MRRHLGFKPAPVTNTLNNPCDKSSAVQHAHLPWHTDVRIHHRIIVGNHILVRGVRGDGMFEGVGRAVEEETPERAVDEMEERENAEGTVGG